ncbi:MAG: porphobilinogen synthase [Geminicoccaceae bacterium]
MPQPLHLLNPAPYPASRPRRLRQHPWSRRLVAEHRLSPADLIQPFFVIEGKGQRVAVPSLPGVERLSVDELAATVEHARELGLPAVALFPVTPVERKSEGAEEAWNDDNLMCRAIRAIKRRTPDIGIIGDVALDPYTSHGQDGLVRDGRVLNDETIQALIRQACCLAAAGCDIVAPSDMMDGRIGSIRAALDKDGHQDTMILSYAAKYASAFYGPFRDAVGSGTSLGKADKKTYQMDSSNGCEALRETALDIGEAADMVMVKPGLPYLDVIYRVKQAFGVPTLAYHVSGEYAMLKAAGEKGWLDADACMLECLLAFKRAGADAILTYAAMDVAGRLAR